MKDEGVMNYVKLTEHNGWEGETWHFFIPYEGNERAITRLEKAMIKFGLIETFGDVDYRLDLTLVPESKVDILVEHGDDGYLPQYNKLSGKLSVPRWKNAEAAEEALYKGGIERLMK